MKKFNKRFLSEVCGFNEEETRITMEAQNKFPDFLVEEGKGFCVDGRTLWKELEAKAQFSDWIKSNLENSNGIENVDFTSFQFKVKAENTWKTSTEFKLTLDIAKEIAMFAGATNRVNDKLKANSKLIRRYFILMEKAVKGIKEHQLIREPEKENYNKMKEEIIKDFESKHTDTTDMDRSYLMIRESNMINTKLIGYTAGQVREKLGYKDVQTREHLLLEQNKVIDYLELIIYGLVIAGIDFESRSKIIGDICKSKYSNLRMDLELAIK